jgi:hypothetical protein
MPKLERRGLIDALTEEERRGALRRYGNLVKLDLIALLSERDETLDALRNLERAHRRERERELRACRNSQRCRSGSGESAVSTLAPSSTRCAL